MYPQLFGGFELGLSGGWKSGNSQNDNVFVDS